MIVLLAFLLQSPATEIDVEAYLRSHRLGDEALVRGDLDQARQQFRRCLDLDETASATLYALACVEARDGQAERALDWFQRAADAGYVDAEVAEWDENLQGLRGTDRYKALLSKMRNAAERQSSTRRIVAIGLRRAASWPCSIALDDQGDYVLVGDKQGTLVLLDVMTGLVTKELEGLPSHVSEVAFHPDGKRIVALTSDGYLHMASVEDHGPRRPFGPVITEPVDPSCCHGALLRFDPSGERVLVAVRDLGASLWTVDGTRIQAWETADSGHLSTRVAWSADGRTIAEPIGDFVRFRDGVTGEPLELTFTTSPPTHAIALHPDGRRIATGHRDGHVRLWDIETNEMIRELRVEDMFEPWVDYVSFSPSGEHVAVTTASSAIVSVFETESGDVLLERVFLGGRICGQVHVSWSPDGERIWFAFAGGPLFLHGFALDAPKARGKSRLHNCLGEPAPPGSLSEFGLGRACPPRISPAGPAAFIRRWGVVGLDTTSGDPIWHRPWLRHEQNLVQAPAGYFVSDTEEIGDLFVFRGSEDKDPLPLSSVATRLFDPKRVRAARAGVPLVPLEL